MGYPVEIVRDGEKWISTSLVCEMLEVGTENLSNRKLFREMSRIRVDRVMYYRKKCVEEYIFSRTQEKHFLYEAAIFVEWVIEKIGSAQARKMMMKHGINKYPTQYLFRSILSPKMASKMIYIFREEVIEFLKWYRSYGVEPVAFHIAAEELQKRGVI